MADNIFGSSAFIEDSAERDYTKVPDFDSLPPVSGMPHGCAWGIFDKDGQKDLLGCLNFITSSVRREAYRECRDGVCVSLNWPMDAVRGPAFDRKGLVHKVISFLDSPFRCSGFDDEVEFNTQCSSQWDSLVHFQHQPTGSGYNGCRPSKDELERPTDGTEQSRALPTLHHWHTLGGLVGRGVLLDYRAFAEAKKIRYSCFEDKRITIEELEDVARHQNLELKHGDVLLLRTGLTEELGASTPQQQADLMRSGRYIGVEGSEESAKWFWNRHFSAVASDTMAFEALPPKLPDGRDGTSKDLGMISDLFVKPHH